ncbi:YceI family protein [Massilia cavernae]|uniref:YceI family protein n=1 Tax=Massilia cavernae TaxID=2320864 RepID=A0A418Y4H1_9BURK|nr:YceI family protein [Massilia cavernae]RJG20527.1 YceI family protein [Massilia cavernae]
MYRSGCAMPRHPAPSPVRRLGTAAIAVVLLLPLPAAPSPGLATYFIDGSQTSPRVEYHSFGFPSQARFSRTRGTITVDRGTRTGTVDVEIEATSGSTGYTLLDSFMGAAEVFDTAQFPLITYSSPSLGFSGDTPAWVDGSLTIKGITRPVRLDIEQFACAQHPGLDKEVCTATAVAKIKRSDFNAGKYAPLVSDEVTLVIPIAAVRR